MFISVIGGGDVTDEVARLAEDVGKELAKRGVGVVCGGLGGVMEAVCRGAKSEGGTTVGILPGVRAEDANKWVDIPICTGIGYARNVIVVQSGSAVIAVDGAFGTLSEIGHALSTGIPVVGLRTWDLARDGVQDGNIIVAWDAVDAVEKAVAAAKNRK